jgi:hypothetical protein
MAKTAIKGRDVAFYVTKPGAAAPIRVGCVGDVGLDINTEADEATCADSAGWKEFVPGQNDWTATANLTAREITGPDVESNVSVNEFVQFQFDQEILKMRFSLGDTRYEGDCFITKNGLKGQLKGAATGAVSFQGTGPLSIVV